MNQGPTYVLRNRSQVLKGILLIIFGAVLVVVTAFDPVEASYLPPGLAALGLVGVASSVFILPRVVVSPAGIETRNWMFRVAVPWNHYRELETKFGMYLVSTDTKDVVASYPGSGGISKGREELGEKHRLGRSTPKSASLPLHTEGTVKRWADMNQAIGLIENVHTNDYLKDKRSKKRQPAPGTRAATAPAAFDNPADGAFPRQRTKSVDVVSAASLVVGVALLLVGIGFSFG